MKRHSASRGPACFRCHRPTGRRVWESRFGFDGVLEPRRVCRRCWLYMAERNDVEAWLEYVWAAEQRRHLRTLTQRPRQSRQQVQYAAASHQWQPAG